MMDGTAGAEPVHLCVTPQKKRAWTPASITNAYSSKRRRVSSVSAEWELESDVGIPSGNQASADRFITAPLEGPAPLNITPRSKRIARNFGLIDDRVLKCSDHKPCTSSNYELSEHRSQIQRLFAAPSTKSPTSAASHLGARKQFILALDGPGIPSDAFAFPLSWSSQNAIAVACGRQLYYQDLDTRVITHLGGLNARREGRLATIEWSKQSPTTLSAGTTTGIVQLWDTVGKIVTKTWKCRECAPVGGMDWRGDMLAVGGSDGTIDLFDTREANPVSRLTAHKCKVFGVRWSPDGDYLATSDQHGIMQIWNARAGKTLANSERMGSKMKSRGPVKALAWCPWKSGIIASGSTYPEGKLRIWNVNSSPSMLPQETLHLDTSVTSLIWAPNCKELLSTHGTSWKPRASSSSALADDTPLLPSGAVPVKTKFTNAITVHNWPALKHVVSVTAHSGPVGHSCVSPDGTMVFTICPAEEAMKMWKVWGYAVQAEPRESVFERCGIR